jgi:S-adenosylmethionine/arginine decarboxylase-like enzyme
MAAEVLGSRMRSFGIVLHGQLTEKQWKEFLTAVCDAIGMYPVGEPAVWTYPLEGKGGTGQTLMLPITESFLVVDTWSDHDGAYLFVCSCREYGIGKIYDVAEEFGLKPSKELDGAFFHQLRLK